MSDMRRREFITLLGGAAAAWPLAARAQQSAMPVIGVMSPLSAATAARNLAALRNGLRDLGYNEGRNITGVLMSGDAGIVGERLELRRDAAPRFCRVGVLVAPDYAAADGTLDALPSAARGLGLDARVYEARAAADIETALTAAGRDGVQALYVSQSPVFLHRRAEIIGRVASLRLPAMYFFREFVQSGGLLSYGSDLPDMYRRAGVYIDKILKGASPSELPVQSAEKFELAVNLKTAKALGLTISESFLLRADEVIE